jgi:hypothetical protein
MGRLVLVEFKFECFELIEFGFYLKPDPHVSPLAPLTSGPHAITASLLLTAAPATVIYNSCIGLMVRFPSEQSQICIFGLLITVKSDLMSTSKILF